MTKTFLLALATLLASTGAHAQAPVTIDNQGWIVSANPASRSLTISYKSLGVVLQDVRLNLENGDDLSAEAGWSVEKTSQSVLTVHTAHPIAAWVFAIRGNDLRISSTLSNAILTGQAPAPMTRIPARTLDTKGFPVDWVGTNEAMLEYGGQETENPSFLPQKNPEVMYFAMGLVSGSAFMPCLIARLISRSSSRTGALLSEKPKTET